MKHFFTRHKPKPEKFAAVLFWLTVWQGVSILLGNSILLPSPLAVAKTFYALLQEQVFWHAVRFSFLRITAGFFAGMAAGVLCAALAYRYKVVRVLLAPLFTVVTAIPVASFIILALVWLNSRSLSVFTAFIMVFPVIYMNALRGLQAVDEKMLEMAKVFEVKLPDKIRYIYLPVWMPFFLSACKTALGLAWKSGIAAEIIGLPIGSIGEQLYLAKLYLYIPEMFSWTIAVILLSACFEKLFLMLIAYLAKKSKGGLGFEGND